MKSSGTRLEDQNKLACVDKQPHPCVVSPTLTLRWAKLGSVTCDLALLLANVASAEEQAAHCHRNAR
jgi:hypothetical protein